MRIGIIAYSTDTGLGNQTWEIYKHLNPTKTLVVDLSMFNQMPTHHERYPDARICDGIPNKEDLDWLTDDVDVVFVCETPLNYYLFETAKKKGVKTVQQFNYEFLDYFRDKHAHPPSLLAAPTTWNLHKVHKLNVAPVEEWRVPVNRELIPYREIKECKTFVHITGRPAANDRNGTLQFLQAARQLQNFNYKLYIQPPKDARTRKDYIQIQKMIDITKQHVDLEVIENTDNYQDMYATGDVMVLPRKYGGLCLPMNEALSAGMPVIMPNSSPNADILPYAWLTDTVQQPRLQTHTMIDVYQANVNSLMKKMKLFSNPTFMEYANRTANDLADKMSWENMKDEYLERLEELCSQE